VTILLRLRRAILLSNLGHRVGELVEVSAESIEQPRNAVPAHAAMAVLKLREVGGADACAGAQLLLREFRPVAELAQRSAKGSVIADRSGRGLMADHCNVRKVSLRCKRTIQVPPRCANSRGRGTERTSSRRVGQPTGHQRRAVSLARPFSRGLRQGGTEMSTMLTVPAEMVEHLRSGLHSGIGDAAETIAQVVGEPAREQHPEWYREPLSHFDRVRALLDTIGWAATDPPAEVSVDLREHRHAVLDALGVAMIVADADLKAAETVSTANGKATIRRVLALGEFAAAVEAQADALGEHP